MLELDHVGLKTNNDLERRMIKRLCLRDWPRIEYLIYYCLVLRALRGSCMTSLFLSCDISILIARSSLLCLHFKARFTINSNLVAFKVDPY